MKGTGKRENTWPAVEEGYGDCIWLLGEEGNEVDVVRFRADSDG